MNPSAVNSSKTHRHDDMHLWLRNDNISTVIHEVSTGWDFLDGRSWSQLSIPDKDRDEYANVGKSYRYKRLAWAPVLDEVRREVPVYSQNYKSSYLQGICDAVISFHIEISGVTECWKVVKKYDEDDLRAKLTLKVLDWERDEEYRKKSGLNPHPRPTYESLLKWPYGLKYTWCPEARLQHDHTLTKRRFDSFDDHEMGYQGERGLAMYRILVDFKPVLTSISGVIGQLKVYRDCIGRSDLMIITYDENHKYDPILKDEGIHIMRIPEI